MKRWGKDFFKENKEGQGLFLKEKKENIKIGGKQWVLLMIQKDGAKTF